MDSNAPEVASLTSVGRSLSYLMLLGAAIVVMLIVFVVQTGSGECGSGGSDCSFGGWLLVALISSPGLLLAALATDTTVRILRSPPRTTDSEVVRRFVLAVVVVVVWVGAVSLLGN